MRMNLISRTRSRLADESGFSMLAVMIVMITTTMFVVGGLAAANGDLPLSRNSQDRKATYAAAEAGLNFYQFHLNADNDYWTKCTNVAAPNGSENSPVNQVWPKALQNGTDPRKWRNVAGSPAQYTIELLPAAGSTSCVEGNQGSMIDPNSGTFKIRVTGRPNATSNLRRSINATFRRKSFLDFLYFTDFETLDPAAYSLTGSPSPTWAGANCGDLYRNSRDNNCTEIQFADFDEINGPFHTNDDSILVCDNPTFGRTAADKIEVSGSGAGFIRVCGSGDPVWKGPLKTGVQQMAMPTTNASLEASADPSYVFTGKTTIRFNGAANTITVTNPYRNSGNPQTLAYPPKGIIFVKQGTCGTTYPPISATYAEVDGCAQVYVSGTYTKSMTLASEGDIIIKPPAGTDNGDVKREGDVVLGLIAKNYVRVYHKVNRSGSCTNVDTTAEPLMDNVTIEAAILSLKHSFIVDNWNCGAKLGTLNVTGAIAQKYRGPVGTGGTSAGGTGFKKLYNYDDRLRYRSPPYFLDPVAASWNVIRTNEQVPATK